MQLLNERRNPRRPWRVLLFLVSLAAAVAVALGYFAVGAVPAITIRPEFPGLGKRTPIAIELAVGGRGLGPVRVELVQGERVTPLAQATFVPRPAWRFWGARSTVETLPVVVGKNNVPDLEAGEATLRVTAERAGTWLRHPAPAVAELVLPVRLVPPSLAVLSTRTYVAQGGAEAVVYRVGEGTTRDGVRAGEWWFPGYPLPGGAPGERFALFAVPYDLADASGVLLVASDAVGNEGTASFIDQFTARPFGTDTIGVSEAFLAKVVPEILGQTPELADRGSLLDNYLQINGDLRRRNAGELRKLAANSPAEFLWRGAFLPLRNGQVMSAFADRRTYVYGDKPVDRQDHLGFDLASNRQAPVQAGNHGTVILARYFGIYGNTVVLDHGYGLLSLYSHLSAIAVAAGDRVERGQVLGRTGETGLAGGDHLHFTTLLQGLPVTPVEWWDEHWIADRLAAKLPAAGLLP
jgi:murein DD-endopeptidase MepM/ murein hydrolase activator NlpD